MIDDRWLLTGYGTKQIACGPNLRLISGCISVARMLVRHLSDEISMLSVQQIARKDCILLP
jgi:hypothetical protein